MESKFFQESLGVLCSYINRGSAPLYTEDTVTRVLNQKCIRGNRVSIDEARQTDAVNKPVTNERFLKPMDILINSTGVGTLGRVAQILAVTVPTTVDSHITIARPDPKKIDPKYMGFAVGALQSEIEALGEGSTGQTELNREKLSGIQVPVPPTRGQQRTIAAILSSLDDKIELNRNTCETLEEMARAIFKSWFVDFDPVRAKMAGKKSETICKRLGLMREILDLFPNKLVDSELGKIPEGWEVCKLNSVTSYLSRGISPVYSELGIRVINQKCIRDGKIDFSLARRHDSSQKAVESRILNPGDILVNSTGVGTLGRISQLLVLDEPTVVDSHVTVVRANNERTSSNYLGLALFDRQNEIETLGEGSTGQTELSRIRFGELSFLLPPQLILAQFDSQTITLRKHSSIIDRHNIFLANIRDALLPKLISGELKV